MKQRILFIIFILSSIQIFSQSEIWGVKQYGGALGGGYLYSIDSLTKKIKVQHRFNNSYYLNRDLDIVSPKVHTSSASILGISDYWLIKYNELTQQVDHQFLNQKAFGSFCEVSDSLWVILKNGGIFKINPYNLELSSIDGFDIVYTTNEVGPVKFSDNELYWNQVIGAYDGAICKMDLGSEEIIKLFDFDENEDANYFPVGKLIKRNNKLYGLSYKQNSSVRGFIIFSYHPGSGAFKEEVFVENKYIQRKHVHGFTELDGLLYSIGRVKKNDKNTYMFSFNPVNRKIDTLCMLEEEISSSPGTHLYVGPENELYCSGNDGGEFDNGSIFKYNPFSNQLEAVYHFQDDFIGPGNVAKPFTIFDNRKLYYFKLSIDSSVSFNLTKLDLESKNQKFVSDLSFLFNSKGGGMPQSILQTTSGKIIGNTIEGGDYTNNKYRGSGVVYQFDPNSKYFEVLHRFNDIGSNLIASDIFLLPDDLLFGVLKSSSRNVNAGKFVLDIETKAYTRLPDFPWENSIVSVEMLTDSMVYAIISNHGYAPYSICRYDVFLDRCDTLLTGNGNEIFDQLEILNNEDLVFQKVIEITDEIDDSYIMKFNLETNNTEILIDLNDYKIHYGSKERFDFKVREDGRLMGTFFNNMRVKDAQRDLWSYRIGAYDPNINNMIIVGDTSRFFDADYYYLCRYKVISDLNNQNQILGFNEVGTDIDKGEFVSVHIENNQIVLNEYLESTSGLITYSLYDDLEISDVCLFRKEVSENFVWTGNADNNWYNKENWLSGQIPDSMNFVVVSSLTSYDPKIDTLVKVKGLTIKENAKLDVLVNGSLSVDEDFVNHGSFKLYACDTSSASFIHHQEFSFNNASSLEFVSDSSVQQFISLPVHTNGFQYSDFRNIYQFSEQEFLWNLVEEYPFYPEVGYACLFDQEMTAVQLSGSFTLDDNKILIPVFEQSKMYPIPNPYTASLNWDEINLSGIENKALYRFDKTDSVYVPYIDGLGWETPHIEPLDVVWVYSKGNEEITLKASDRFHKSQKTLDDHNPDNQLVLSVSDLNHKDQTIISLSDAATSDFDGALDAVKYSDGILNRPIIFTKAKNEILSINQHPDTSVMDLFVEAANRGEYTISIDKRNGFDFVMLEDLIWNKRIDLLQQDYRFEYFPSDGHYPFKLYFKEWVLEPLEETDFLIYYYPESIYIKSKKQIEEAQIFVYDLAGKLVWESEAKEFSFFKKQIDLVGGNYILQVKSGDIVKNKMIWVRE